MTSGLREESDQIRTQIVTLQNLSSGGGLPAAGGELRTELDAMKNAFDKKFLWQKIADAPTPLYLLCYTIAC